MSAKITPARNQELTRPNPPCMKAKTTPRTALLAPAVLSLIITNAAYAGASVSWNPLAAGTSYAVGTVVTTGGVAAGVAGAAGGGLDLALILDSSSSMGSNAAAGQLAQRAAALALVSSLPSATSSVAILDFRNTARLRLALTPVSTGLAAINTAITAIATNGGTSFAEVIPAAATELLGSNHTAGRSQVIVMVTDGSGNGNATANAAVLAGTDNIHTVGLPGHTASSLQGIVDGVNNVLGDSDDIGVYTSSTLAGLTGLFNGTSGNLVGLKSVKVTLPNGTVLNNVATDGLGNFSLAGWTMKAGANNFTVKAFGNDGTTSTSTLTLYGIKQGGSGGSGNSVPDGGGTAAMLGASLFSLILLKKKKRK